MDDIIMIDTEHTFVLFVDENELSAMHFIFPKYEFQQIQLHCYFEY